MFRDESTPASIGFAADHSLESAQRTLAMMRRSGIRKHPRIARRIEQLSREIREHLAEAEILNQPAQ